MTERKAKAKEGLGLEAVLCGGIGGCLLDEGGAAGRGRDGWGGVCGGGSGWLRRRWGGGAGLRDQARGRRSEYCGRRLNLGLRGGSGGLSGGRRCCGRSGCGGGREDGGGGSGGTENEVDGMHGGGADEDHGSEQDDASGDEALDAAGVVLDLAVLVEGALDADEEESEADEGEEDAGDHATRLLEHAVLGHMEAEDGGEVGGVAGGVGVEVALEGEGGVEGVAEDVEDGEDHAQGRATQGGEDAVADQRVAR